MKIRRAACIVYADSDAVNNHTTTFTYDTNNRRTTTADPVGNITTFTWNNADLHVATTDANSNTTTFSYDPDNRRTALTDANGHITAFAYDNAGDMTVTTDPLNQKTSYTYDHDHRTSTMTDAMGHVTTYSWDNINRLTGKTFADGRAYGYAYDGNSNRTLMTDPTGTTTWIYDPANRTTGQQNPTGITGGFSYDNDNRLTAGVYSTIGTFAYAYDNVNRNTQLTNPAGEITTSTFDADSRLNTRTLANGVTGSFGYDAASNITALTYATSTGTTLASYANSYNAANMRTSSTDLAGNITTWTYDGTYQAATATGGIALGWADMTVDQWTNLTVDQWATLPVDGAEVIQSNQYDSVGNALVMVTTGGTVTNSYDQANRLTASVTPIGTITFDYDADNRRTQMTDASGNITTYTWTDDNQLAAFMLPNSGGTVTNTYDGDGLRFSRTDGSGTNSYLWNGQVLEAQLGNGNTVSTWYTQGVGDGQRATNHEQRTTRSGEFGDIISTHDVAGGATSWPQYDASGNVSQTTDINANITTTLAYDTFGVITDNSGPQNPTVAWQGKQGYQFEPTFSPAGLQYVRQRWYDPATRQFISPDPLGFAGGDVNLFRYAGNNPVNRNDPGGEQFGNNFDQMGDGFSFYGPLIPSAPLQHALNTRSPNAIQRAVIAKMPTHTAAQRLAKQEALRELNEPIDVPSVGYLFSVLVAFPFVLSYESGKHSYQQATANTTILATRHLEHGGSFPGAVSEAISYNVLSLLGPEKIMEGSIGTTLVHPQLLTTSQRAGEIIIGGVQFATWAAPELHDWYIGIKNPALRDFWQLQSFRLGGYGYTRLRAIAGVTSRQEIGQLGEYIGLQTLRHEGITGLIQIKNPSGHGIDVAGHDLMQAVFGEFKASLGEKAPGLSAAQRDFERFMRARLERAAGAREGAWQATPAQVKAAARNFLDEIGKEAIPKGVVVEVTKLGSIRYQVIIRGWH